jgi:PAS domain S-box-containing protein
LPALGAVLGPRGSPWRSSEWGIGFRLALLVILLAAPLNVLAVAALYHLATISDGAHRASLQYTARSLAAAVDAQLARHIALGQALASSPALLGEDLSAFDVEARRAFGDIDDAWVLVADRDGRQLMNLAARQSPIPPRDPDALIAHRQALASGRIVVSDVVLGSASQEWLATINLPISRNGVPDRVLAITMSARSFHRLLNAQSLPEGWLAGIVDTRGRFMARSADHERHVGQLASEGWRGVLNREGVFDFVSLEGEPLLQAVALSTQSAWSVGVAEKKSQVLNPAWRTVGWTAVIGGLISALCLVLAVGLSRRIRGPILELQHKATELVCGQPVTLASTLPEVREVWTALTTAVADRNQIEERLRRNEERLRLAQTAAGLGAWELDPSSRLYELSDGARELLGIRSIGAVSVDDVLERVHREDRPAVERAIDQAWSPSGDGQLHLEFRVVDAGGAVRWLEDHGRVAFQGKGTSGPPERALGVMRDVTQRKAAEAASAHLAAIVESSSDAIASKSLDGTILSWNAAAERMFGYAPEEIIGQPVTRIIPPERLDEETRILEKLRRGQRIQAFETLRVAKDGRIFPVSLTISPIFDRAGVTIAASKIVRDISERKKREATIELLLRELDHRSKNLMSLVMSIARHTAASSPGEFIDRFGRRIQALAANQNLLVRNDWRGTDVGELVRAQLAHLADVVGDKVTLAGPSVRLCSEAAQCIGIAVHELATNASKHGALSVPNGKVEVVWRRETTRDGDRFTISWRERDGPPVSAPARSGFGTTLLTTMARMTLSAEVELDYAPSGLSWHLSCPAEKALEAAPGQSVS